MSKNSVKMAIRAISHDLRSQIIDLLSTQKSATVTQIYTELNIEQAVASQHLKILRDSNVAVTERKGKFIIYSLNEKTIDILNDIEEKYGEFFQPKLQAAA